MFYLSGQDDGV